MYVIALRHAAVFMNAGSYERTPSLARSVARIAPSTIGKTCSSPVRLSTTVRVSSATTWSVPVLRGVDALNRRAPLLEPIRRDVDRPALADHRHLDLPGVLEMVLDLAGDLVREEHGAVVVDLVRLDEHADLAA